MYFVTWPQLSSSRTKSASKVEEGLTWGRLWKINTGLYHGD